MPEVQEVFRMATQKVDQEPGALERQVARQQRAARNRRMSAYAAAVVFLAATVAIYALTRGDTTGVPATGAPTSSPHAAGSAIPTGSVVDLRTGAITPLPASIAKSGSDYAVSPDDTTLAFNSCCAPPHPIYLAEVDGTRVRLATAKGTDAFGAQWSPDGSLLVYQQRGATDTIGNLFALNIGTGQRTRITNFDQMPPWNFLLTYPSFAPDGQSILFEQPRGDPNNPIWDLWSVPVRGGKQTLVRRNAAWGGYSPDGKSLAYLSPTGTLAGAMLWVTSVHAGTPRALVTNGLLSWPKWSPDGTRISYCGDSGWIYVVDVATRSTRKVVQGGTADCTAEWFDNHTLIVGPGSG